MGCRKDSSLLHYTEAASRCVLLKKCVLKNIAKFTEERQCWSLFFNKVAGLSPATNPPEQTNHYQNQNS